MSDDSAWFFRSLSPLCKITNLCLAFFRRFCACIERTKCEEHQSCGACVLSNRPTVDGTPVKDVCQWCRHTGSCFNSTAQSSGSTPASRPSSAIICQPRCVIKEVAMCPPMDLQCDKKKDCAHCTNNSFCSFCDSTQSCFNPCGDDAPKFPPKEPSVEPSSVPIAPVTFEPMFPEPGFEQPPFENWEPLNGAPEETKPIFSRSKSELVTFEAPTCPSCVWSVPGMCAVASTCRKMKNCGECTANPGCGWCGSSVGGSCVPAIDKKPCTNEGGESTCKYWSYGNCETACNAHSDCGACLGGGCEWCAGGFFHGRRTSYCAVRHTTKQCIASFHEKCPNCSTHSNCTSCLHQPYCGYCANSNPSLSKCVEGEPVGPYDPSDCSSNPPERNNTWITSCQPWNTTQPLPKPPVHPPITPPVYPPVQPPIEPPEPVEAPIMPPVSEPISQPISEPQASPTSPTPTSPPPKSEEPSTTPVPEESPISPPAAPPKHQPPSIAPVTPPHATTPSHILTPAQALQPYIDMIHKRYTIGFIIGGSVAGGIVLFGGLLWVKLHASATHRYRTIGT